MTTIRSRLAILDSVIGCLAGQTMKPHKILLNISQEPYGLDEGITVRDLPPFTCELVQSGLVIVSTVPNTGPYRKLMPALRKFHDCGDVLIATVDDDVFYPPGWLAGLYSEYKTHGCICAYRCRRIVLHQGRLRPYRNWLLIDAEERELLQKTEASGLLYLPTGKGGVLYHPSFFKNPDLLERLSTFAPTNDDLGLRFATLPYGINVRIVDYRLAGAQTIEFPGTDIGRILWDINKKTNDRMLADIWTHLRSRGYLDGIA